MKGEIKVNNQKTFFISDTHFNHANIIKYCNRPFKTVDEMNSKLISNWNSVVSDNDIVYFLGDFAFGDKEAFSRFAAPLKGHKHFIIGNHDRISKKIILDAGFESVNSQLILKYEEYNFFLTHYPREVEKGEICIYGHVHDKKEELSCRSFCVCVEQINYTPIEINELIRRI